MNSELEFLKTIRSEIDQASSGEGIEFNLRFIRAKISNRIEKMEQKLEPFICEHDGFEHSSFLKVTGDKGETLCYGCWYILYGPSPCTEHFDQ